MIKQLTLITFFNLLFLNNVFAYNSENNCEKELSKNDYKKAKQEAEKLINNDPFSGNFCMAKVLFSENKAQESIALFEKTEKLAQHPADQMLSIMFKGLAYKENNDLKQSLSIFSTGYETAKLGNSKFVQFERRFLIQMGDVKEKEKDNEKAYEYFAMALKSSSNDDERAESYDRLAKSAASQGFYDRAREYSLKGSIMYQKSGYLGEFAELTILKGEYEVLDNDYEKGIRTLKDLEELCIEAGGDYYLAKTYLKLYKLSKEDKDVYLAKAKEVATRIGADDLIKDINSI
jgi:tetratricopeptide (TPR) repeat protein